MSTYSEALTALIDQQYAIEQRNHASMWKNQPEAAAEFPCATRDEIAANRENIRISATVMQILDGDDFYNSPEVDYGTFDNCREYGMTVTIAGWVFAAYEHRNSDYICITACPVADVKPYGPYAADGDKYECILFDTKWKDYHGAATALVAGMNYVKHNLDHATTEGISAAMKETRS